MSFTVLENSTVKYTAQIQDEAGVGIPAASLTTLVLTHYNKASGAIIAGRDHQSVLNANGVTVDTSGNLVWTMLPADNPVLDQTLDNELHVALFEWTYASTKAGKHEVRFTVRNLTKVP